MEKKHFILISLICIALLSVNTHAARVSPLQFFGWDEISLTAGSWDDLWDYFNVTKTMIYVYNSLNVGGDTYLGDSDYDKTKVEGILNISGKVIVRVPSELIENDTEDGYECSDVPVTSCANGVDEDWTTRIDPPFNQYRYVTEKYTIPYYNKATWTARYVRGTVAVEECSIVDNYEVACLDESSNWVGIIDVTVANWFTYSATVPDACLTGSELTIKSCSYGGLFAGSARRYVEGKVTWHKGSGTLAELDGDTYIGGKLDMNDNKIENVATPTTDSDAVTKAYVDSLVGGSTTPQGVIVMWSGTLATIPMGWTLCDGTGSTPDLRDRFIYGTSTAEDPGATGGESMHTLTTAEMPAHTHTYNRGSNSGVGGVVGGGGAFFYTYSSPQTSSTGSGVAHENKPPYYKLAFIMKT